jgi:hypothetical protein
MGENRSGKPGMVQPMRGRPGMEPVSNCSSWGWVPPVAATVQLSHVAPAKIN